MTDYTVETQGWQGTFTFTSEKKATNAAIWVRALSKMPGRPGRPGGYALYGQAMQLARVLGYGGIFRRGREQPNHARIYNLFRTGGLPRDPVKRAHLLKLAGQ